MVNPRNHRVRQFVPWAVPALATLLLAAPPAPAQVPQFWIAPDRSIVVMGPQQRVPVVSSFVVTPVVVSGNRFVRVGGTFSATVVNTTVGFPGTGFIKPFYPSDRGRAANFLDGPNYNPNPVITGPFQRWWP